MNGLEQLTDQELWNTDLTLALVCGRNNAVMKKARRQYSCLLRQSLKDEADRRGNKVPTAPYGVGDYRHDPSGAI